MNKCYYCNSEYDDKNFTKEHIFPNFFYEILGLKDNQVKYLSFNESLNISNRKELIIKNVCSKCNNNILSKLDIEFSSLIKPFILNNTFLNQNVNYSKIIKWLIKTFFNSYVYINQKAVIELYKNNFVNLIIKNKVIERELLFSVSLRSNNLNDSFMSIGIILEPRKLIKYLDVYTFIQIKNYMLILVVFKRSKHYKKYSKEIIKYLKYEYNAVYHNKAINLQTIPIEKLPIEIIYNANEDNTNIPFKLLCKLQWNLDNKIDTIYESVQKLTNNPIDSRLLIGQYNLDTNALYSSSKSLFIVADNISILLHFNSTCQITRYSYHICNYKYNDLNKVKVYKNANIILHRYDGLTSLKMNDLNDLNNPFIGTLNVKQNEVNWEKFKANIKNQYDFIYIAMTDSKALEKQLDNGSFKNITFISKVKVEQIYC